MLIDPRIASFLVSGTKILGKDLYDKVKDKGEDALTNAVIAAVNNKQLKNELESLFANEQSYHSDSNTIDSEYNFPVLADYLSKNAIKECEQYIFAIDQDQRDRCKDDIIRKALAYADPDSDEAKERVEALTTAYLNVICNYFSGKIDPEQLQLAGKIVGAIKSELDKQTAQINTHSDQNTAEIRKLIADDHAETMTALHALRNNRSSELLTDQRKQKIPERCLAANKRYLQNEILSDVLPEIRREGKQYNNTDCLEQLMHDCWKEAKENSHHIILTADGGMGKTSLLLYTATKLLNNADVLYVPLERLNAASLSIERYICRSLFNEDRNDGKLYELAKDSGDNPALILLIDGFNELNGEGQDNVIKQIKDLMSYPGIQLVITSREDFGNRLGLLFTRAELSGLSEDRIKSFLTEDEWKHISDDRYHALIELLSVPMMLLMYKQICPLIDKHQESFLSWIDPIQNATDLIHNWYVSQIAVLLDRNGITGEYVTKVYKIIAFVLPDIGYLFECENSLTFTFDKFEKILDGLTSCEFEADQQLKQLLHRYQIREANLDCYDVEDYLLNDSHLMHENDEFVSFPHQMYRDYLSAKFILINSQHVDRIDTIWNDRYIPEYLADHIRNMNPSYWKESGIAKNVADYSRGKDHTDQLNKNLIDLFPYTVDSGTPDFSGLNLENCRLTYYPQMDDMSLISLKNAKLSLTSLEIFDEKITLYRCFAFSPDHKWFVAKSDGIIHIWSLITNTENLTFQDSYASGKFCFSSDSRYLYYIPGGTDDVWIFGYDEVSLFWRQTAIINGVLKNVRNVVLSNGQLFLYYKNRVSCFQIYGGKCIFNKQERHAYEHLNEGDDLSDFFAHRDGSGKDEQFIKNDPDDVVFRGFSEDKLLEARCYSDGTLSIYSNGSLQQTLRSGRTTIKSASISGDGKRLVTLSKRIHNGNSTLSMWNLDQKRRLKDTLCSSSIDEVHLSDTGDWIICKKQAPDHFKSEWIIINWNGLSVYTVEGELVSNQIHKLTTYGNKVFYKGPDHALGLFDLRTHEITPLPKKIGVVSLATFLPDGRIATVSKDRRRVFIRSQDGRNNLELNTEQIPVIGIAAMKGKPFITVALSNGRNYVFHTGNGKLQRGKGDTTKPKSGNKIVVDHPSANAYACSAGLDQFEIWNCWDSGRKSPKGKPVSFWYCNQFKERLTGNVLDMDFNEANHQLVTVTSNGEIIFCHELYCNHAERRMIITNISMDQYDFIGAICNDEVKQILIDNRASI